MTVSARHLPFYFGVPLIAREAARDWDRVCLLFEQTLRSVLAQSDPDFRVLLAGHDAPASWRAIAEIDPRLEFIEADWPVAPPSSANDDGGMKKWMIREKVVEDGGGLLMYLDADDLIDRRTVEVSRDAIGPDMLGGIVRDGFAIDHRSGHAVAFPHAEAFDGAFHQLCGSSTVARLMPGEPNAFDLLGSHHEWEERARETGARLASLPLYGGYLVNSGENHSENEGQYALWRRRFSRLVAEQGAPLSQAMEERLGLSPAERIPQSGRGPARRARAS